MFATYATLTLCCCCCLAAAGSLFSPHATARCPLHARTLPYTPAQTQEERDLLLGQLLTLVQHFNEGHPAATQDIALSSCGTKPLVDHTAEATLKPKTSVERVAGGVLKLEDVDEELQLFTL